ncbi:diaminopimelate epimerase [Haloferacaceae archaeon DSL9]
MSALNHSIPFQKYHGTGNDFLVVDATDPIPDRGTFASAHCDRDAGVTHETIARRGADGVLFLDLTERFSPPRVVMTLVQPDGSIAAMCGNGARCAAAWAHDQTGATEFMIDTQAGTRHAVVDDDVITIDMGEPLFDPRAVPLVADRDDPLVEESVEGLPVTAVNTGVPHAVAFVEEVDEVDLDAVAPAVRHADAFRRGANVTLASPVDPDDPVAGFRQRTYERGVEGETRSCGTGAVAIVAAARRTGRLDAEGPVTVTPPGGDLSITVPETGLATLAGPVEYEFDGTLPALPAE